MDTKNKKNSKFNVRSAYKFFREKLRRNKGERSSVHGQKNLWKVLWKMKIPNTINIFAWRACRECLPTQSNLRRKKVDVEDECWFCKTFNML